MVFPFDVDVGGMGLEERLCKKHWVKRIIHYGELSGIRNRRQELLDTAVEGRTEGGKVNWILDVGRLLIRHVAKIFGTQGIGVSLTIAPGYRISRRILDWEITASTGGTGHGGFELQGKVASHAFLSCLDWLASPGKSYRVVTVISFGIAVTAHRPSTKSVSHIRVPGFALEFIALEKHQPGHESMETYLDFSSLAIMAS